MTIFNRSDKPDEAVMRPSQSPPGQRPSESTVKPQELAAPLSVTVPPATPTKAELPMASIISKAAKVTGRVESTEDLQIDGHIEGDVRGVGVKIGQSAKVKGGVYGDEVDLAGTIEGEIESKKVIVRGTARMIGDVSHKEIIVEAGAYISGNLKPDLGKTDTRRAPK